MNTINSSAISCDQCIGKNVMSIQYNTISKENAVLTWLCVPEQFKACGRQPKVYNNKLFRLLSQAFWYLGMGLQIEVHLRKHCTMTLHKTVGNILSSSQTLLDSNKQIILSFILVLFTLVSLNGLQSLSILCALLDSYISIWRYMDVLDV